jgi:hypothetical protein
MKRPRRAQVDARETVQRAHRVPTCLSNSHTMHLRSRPLRYKRFELSLGLNNTSCWAAKGIDTVRKPLHRGAGKGDRCKSRTTCRGTATNHGSTSTSRDDGSTIENSKPYWQLECCRRLPDEGLDDGSFCDLIENLSFWGSPGGRETDQRARILTWVPV